MPCMGIFLLLHQLNCSSNPLNFLRYQKNYGQQLMPGRAAVNLQNVDFKGLLALHADNAIFLHLNSA